MKTPKNQSRRKSTSQASPTLNESSETVLTRRQAAQLTHQTRSKNKTNEISKKGELNRKSRDRKFQERKKKKALLNFMKDKNKSSSLNNEISQRNKSNDIGMSSSKYQSASPRKVEQKSEQSSSRPEKETSVGKSDSGSGNFTLTASKSKSMLDRSKIMLEKELRTLRKQIRKPILVLDGPEECYRKGLNGSKDTNEESAPQGLIENEGRCPGLDKFGRPMTDIPDVVIFKEELEDIDEDDIMDIVLCPSPVWWEEPIDEELKTMFKEEGEPQQNTESTALEVQNQSRTSSNAENNKKKSFTLEKILENIRLKNTNSEKKNNISDQNNTVGTVIVQKSGSENRDIENKIGNIGGNISENTSVSDTNLNVSENIHSVNLIPMEVETEKIASNFKTTTTVNYSSEVHEHSKQLMEDTTDKEVALITQIFSPALDEKSTKNYEKDTKTCMVDLTLNDDEDDTEITSFDPDVAENQNQNLDLKLLRSPSEMDCHIFENNSEQNENNSELNAGTSTENNSKTKSHKQVEDIAKCAINYDNNDIRTGNFKYFAKDKEIPNPLIVVEVGDQKMGTGETKPIEELDREEDVVFISDENESEHQKAPNLVYKDFDKKISIANKGNNMQDLITKDITRSNAERTESIPEILCVGGYDNVETESDSKELVFKTETIMNVPTIEMDIENVILEKENGGKVISEKDFNGEEKSVKEEGNEEDIFIDKMATVIDEEINVNIVAANMKQESLRELGYFTEFQKNIDEKSVNLVEIPIKNEHVPEKTNDTNLFQENIENNNIEALNENSTSHMTSIIALSDLDLDDSIMSKTLNSGSKSTQTTAVTEIQTKTCDKELTETDEDSENPETSINVPNLLSTSTENKEPNLSVVTEICTENEASVSSETNVEKPEDKTKRIREEMKVIEEGLRMAQQIQKLSESHIDSSKRNKLLELSSELLETLKSSMHELKDADNSKIPSLSENKTSDEVENDNQKETIMRKSSEESTEKDVSVNVQLENLRNKNVHKQNTEDIAVCTIVSDNLKKQVKQRDVIARTQKIRSTYLDIVNYESNYKKDKITPTQKSDVLSNSEKEGREQSISFSTSKSYNPASELSTNESSNSETHVIAPSSRNIILKDIPCSADEVQKLALNCESLNTSSEISTNDPICGATPISTSPRADFLENHLPSDASKIWDADNSSNFSCSQSIAEIPQESAKRLTSNSDINITEIMNPDERVSLNSKGIKLGQSLKEIGKLRNCSSDFKRKKTFVPKHLNNTNTKISTLCKSNGRKFRNLQISKKRNVKMKSKSPVNDTSTTFQENVDEYERKTTANSSKNIVSVNFEDKSYETNKLESNTSHNLEPKTENENSENDGSYDDILKSLQSLIDENNGPAITVEHSENKTSREAVSRLDKEVSKPNNSESSLNLNGSEIALADLKAIANGQNRHIRKLSPQKYVEMNKLVILETAFKSTSISNISKDSEIEKNQKQHYVEMNSLFIMDSQKETLTPKLEELVPNNENPLEISSESLKKIREILGIPEFDRSVIHQHSLDDISSEKSYTESIDGSLNDEHADKKIIECDKTISLECRETFDPKMDLCNTLGIPYVEYSKGDESDVKHKSLIDLKGKGMMKSSPPLEAVANNIGKENLDNATKTRDVRTKRKRVDYKQLAKGIRNDSSEIKRIKTGKQEKSETDGDTKLLTQDMIANIIGVNATASNDSKLENIYLNIDPNLYKNSCKHRKKETETQCQKCTLHFTYNSCIKLLTNSQSESDSKLAEDASKSFTCNKLYKCGQCDYVCARRDNLRTHFRKHTDERPYDCGVCDHKARTKDHLTRHQRTHDNLPKDDWRKSHREAQKMICESAVKTVPEEVFRDHSYARH